MRLNFRPYGRKITFTFSKLVLAVKTSPSLSLANHSFHTIYSIISPSRYAVLVISMRYAVIYCQNKQNVYKASEITIFTSLHSLFTGRKHIKYHRNCDYDTKLCCKSSAVRIYLFASL